MSNIIIYLHFKHSDFIYLSVSQLWEHKTLLAIYTSFFFSPKSVHISHFFFFCNEWATGFQYRLMRNSVMMLTGFLYCFVIFGLNFFSLILLEYAIISIEGVHGVMVIVVGNGHSDPSSNPGWSCFYIT